MRFLRSLRLLLLPLLLMCALLGTHVDPAHACGAFASPRRATETEAELAARLPFLTVEQVLLLWDKDTGVEDFIRETRFDKANQVFGFVVPTPTKPEVAAVKKAPFDALRKAYAFEPPRPPEDPTSRGLGGLGGSGKGAGAGNESLPPPVVVLSEQRIGSFTAFTLATTDAGAFDKWLADNGFAMTAEAKPWIARYIKQEFFFVALRYEPKGSATTTTTTKDAGGESGVTAEMTSETIRIRFKTPHPYYPYMEPALAKDASAPYSRMLTGWLVTREPMDAVVYRGKTEYEPRPFHRPWSTGISYPVTTEELARVVGPELRPIVPASPQKLTVQTFRDLKTRRTGYGDVVFVPNTPKPLTPEDREARKFLLSVVDPTLLQIEEPDAGTDSDASPPPLDIGDGGIGASATPSPTPSPSSSAGGGKRSMGCSSSPSSSSSSSAFAISVLVAVIVFAVRRRPPVAALALLGCLAFVIASCRPRSDKTNSESDSSDDNSNAKPPTIGVQSPPPPPPPRAPTREEKIEKVFTILSGAQPEEGIVADAYQAKVQGPKGNAQIGGSTVTPAISDADRVLAGLRPRLRQCYQTGLNHDPSMAGKIILTAEIAKDGSVTEADVPTKTNTGLSPSVAKCCANVLRRAQFNEPEGGKPAKLSVPITFVPQQ